MLNQGIAALLAMPDDLPFEQSVSAAPSASGPRAQEETAQPEGEHIADSMLARTFMLAGHATFTVVSKASGKRFTFKLSRPKPDENAAVRFGPARRKPIFIAVLSGADNTSDYAYLGTIWEDAEKLTYAHGKRSRIAEDAPSVRAAKWVSKMLNNPALMDQCEIWHAGSCGRCGRKLTVPESIRTGLGPECASRMEG